MKITFPPNPTNKMIFEVIPGLFYQYESGSNSWIRIDGAAAVGLATPLVNGLMSNEDFKKLQGLIIPPPQASLSGEDCTVTYKSGSVSLQSTDGSLQISDKLNLRRDNTNIPTPWKLHGNTAGIDFRLNLQQFIDKITSLGNITKIQLQGDQGPAGPKGKPGRNALDTGPVGVTGAAGQNSTYGGTLSAESLPLEVVASSQNRAIVDISVDEVSPTENYLVITRANIGNPDACPSELIPQAFNSTWVVALSEATKPTSTPQSVSIDGCSTCRTCASTLYYINLDQILSDIYARFLHRIDLLQQQKEALVRSWLRTMVELFNQQKSALCCALENCKSRTRNTNTRQYIETQRIQAALGNFSLVIDGANDHEVTDMDKFKNCPVPPPSPIAKVVTGQECAQCALTFKLDSKSDIVDPRTGNTSQSLTGYLPAGTYVASISACCADLNTAIHQFTGRCSILYRANIVNGSSSDIIDNVVSFPDFGTFDNIAAARNAYQGVTVSFEHAGGNISVWIIDPDNFVDDNQGEIDICIQSERCLGATGSEPSATRTAGAIFIYRGDIKNGTFIGAITPFIGSTNAIDNYGLSGGNAHLITGPTLEEKKAKIFFYEGIDGLSFFYVANKAGGTFKTNINNQFTVVNNSLNTSVLVADGQLTPAGIGVFGGNWQVNGDTEGGVIGHFDPTGLWSLIIDPTNMGLLTEWDAVAADGSVVILALNPNGIGGQVNGLLSNSGVTLGNPCNVPTGYGPNCGMTVYNRVAGQLVYVRKTVSIGSPVPGSGGPSNTTGCGPNTTLVSNTLNHGPNPPSNIPIVPDNNNGQIFTIQLGNGTTNGPGPFATLLTVSILIESTQTVTVQCNGIVDSYADATFMQLVDDRGVVLAQKQLTHPAILLHSNGKDGNFTVNPFSISGTAARNVGETLTVNFVANYATLNGRLSGSMLRDGSTLSVVGDKPCAPTVTSPPNGTAPTVAPTVRAHPVQNNQGYIVYATNWRVAYTFILANGSESILSPSVYVTQNQANIFNNNNQFDVSAITLPAGVIGVNYYISGVYSTPTDALKPFLFSTTGSGVPITINPPATGAKAAPANSAAAPVAATQIVAGQIANPTIKPSIGVANTNQSSLQPNTTVNIEYTFLDSHGGETLPSPAASVMLNVQTPKVIFDIAGTIPMGVASVNVYMQVAGSSQYVLSTNVPLNLIGTVSITSPPAPATSSSPRTPPTTNTTKV